MQTRDNFDVLDMELRLPCIKSPKLYVNSTNGWKHISIRCSYRSDAKRGKRSFLISWHCNTFWSVKGGGSRRPHLNRNDKQRYTQAASGHEMATIISSFSEWLLWVIVFTNIAIDIVTIIQTGIGAVVAIDIDILIKLLSLVDKVKCNMVNKVCGMWLIHSVSLLYLGIQRPPPNHRPLPKLSLRLLGQQPRITGRSRNTNQVPLNRFVIVANI